MKEQERKHQNTIGSQLQTNHGQAHSETCSGLSDYLSMLQSTVNQIQSTFLHIYQRSSLESVIWIINRNSVDT